jgi:predicted O-methyltransferase YrrM
MNTLTSPRVAELLDRLFAESDASEAARQEVAQSGASRLMTSKTEYRQLYTMMKDIPLPVSRETGALLYMLTRSSGAKTILEFGTSFGVSTIHLAAGLRDNGGGRIITTEFESSKIARAREHLTTAGLMDLVEIREGDALETLSHTLPAKLDLVLLDGAKGLYLNILDRIEARLRPGSLVLADDAHHCPDYLRHMRADGHRYLSVSVADDVELSMRLQ